MMKKVHFEEIKISWIWAGLLIMVLVSLGFNLFGMFEFENPIWNKLLRALPHLILVIFWSRPFWYRYHVQYNSRYAMLRLGTFFGKTLIFDKINSYSFNKDELIIFKTNGKKTDFDLSNLYDEDRKRILRIFEKNVQLVHY